MLTVLALIVLISVALPSRVWTVLNPIKWIGWIKARKAGGKDGKAEASPAKEDDEEDSTANDDDDEEEEEDYFGMKTRDLLIAVLRKMNCLVEEDEDDAARISFNFQGENFCATASNDCLMVTIYDFSWGNVPLDDIDEVSNLRKAINTTNLYTGLTVAYTISKEHQRMVVHTKRQILLTPSIHNIKTYMQAMLSGFFEVHRVLNRELDKLREGKTE